jgi:hypothetical protein
MHVEAELVEWIAKYVSFCKITPESFFLTLHKKPPRFSGVFTVQIWSTIDELGL